MFKPTGTPQPQKRYKDAHGALVTVESVSHNVGKRRACEGCTEDCYTCSWAFPEKFGITTMLHLPEASLRRAQQLADAKGFSLDEIVDYAIRKL